MDLLNNLALGFQTALSIQNLLYAFFGAVLGTLIRAIRLLAIAIRPVIPSSAARAASSVASEAPSRKEKEVWQWSSANGPDTMGC